MVMLTDRPDMTLDVYRGRKTTKQQYYNFPQTIGDWNSLTVSLISASVAGPRSAIGRAPDS